MLIDIPVLMVNTKLASYDPENTPETFFRVVLDNPTVRLEGTNIDQLKKDVFAEIKTKLAIDWRNVIVVTVSGNRQPMAKIGGGLEGESSCGVSIKCERVQIAEFNGKKMHRESTGQTQNYDFAKGKSVDRFIDHYGQPREGWPWAGEEVDQRPKYNQGDGRIMDMTAIIDDTPENRAALEAIAGGFVNLIDKLKSLLAPEQIAASLSNLSAIKLLT